MASSDRKLHIVVTCTERKTAKVPERLRLRNVPDGKPWVRASAWVERLTAELTTLAVPASDLYAGEHWTKAKGLPGLAEDTQAHLWACSAGYGLISAQARVQPYAATLSPGHHDSVSSGRTDAAAWWEAIASWGGPEPEQPRTLHTLAESDPNATFLLVLSATYLQACSTDIEKAAAVADPDRFMIVSAGTRTSGPLERLFLPANARLEAPLGGSRQVLNVRIAEDLLKRQLMSRAAATGHLTDLLEKHPEIKRYGRQTLSDDEVINWIRAECERGCSASASRMLRVFRDSGYACEQHRFGELHRKLIGSKP